MRDDTVTAYLFPKVLSSDWCGEWQENDDFKEVEPPQEVETPSLGADSVIMEVNRILDGEKIILTHYQPLRNLLVRVLELTKIRSLVAEIRSANIGEK
jgi:hypothetical protein